MKNQFFNKVSNKIQFSRVVVSENKIKPKFKAEVCKCGNASKLT